MNRNDHPRRRSTDMLGTPAARAQKPKREDWALEHSDLDDLENALRYLEHEDPAAWQHVTILLNELRDTVEES